MKNKGIRYKYFNTNEEYFNFMKKEDIIIKTIEITHNFKIKVGYVIIYNKERS